MNTKALLGALVGAVVGAVIWAGVSYFTGYEVGWVAWGIGALVGGGAKAMGSNDKATAGACAVLALASIFAGKVIAVEVTVGDMVNKVGEAIFNQQYYDEYKVQVAEFHELKSEDEYPAFILKHELRDMDAEGDVTAEEIRIFKEESIPELKKFKEDQPSFETWKSEQLAGLSAATKNGPSTVDAVVEELGIIDIAFAIFGVLTAYKLALGDAA